VFVSTCARKLARPRARVRRTLYDSALAVVCRTGLFFSQSSMTITSFAELAPTAKGTGMTAAGVSTLSFARAKVLSRLRFTGIVGALALRNVGNLAGFSLRFVELFPTGFRK
jgi:hypothetical protein